MDKLSLIRTLVLLLALLNQLFTSAGKSPLPIEDETIEVTVSTAFTIVASVWAWWKNNYLSDTGLKQKEALKQNGLYKK